MTFYRQRVYSIEMEALVPFDSQETWRGVPYLRIQNLPFRSETESLWAKFLLLPPTLRVLENEGVLERLVVFQGLPSISVYWRG